MLHRTIIQWISRPDLNHGRIGFGQWKALCICGFAGCEYPNDGDAKTDAAAHIERVRENNQDKE